MNKPVIICVDDDQTILDSLEISIKKSLGNEYIIEIASSGEEALELLQELLEEEYEVPLIISDHLMPKMQGDELLKRIQEISPKTLKILLTGQMDIDAIAKVIESVNLYRYIPKPWQHEDLQLTVQEAVNSYFQDKKLAEQNAKLQQINETLAKLNREQAALIAKLHANESRLQQFLDAMPVGVIVLDRQGKIYYINQKAKEIFGQEILPDTNLANLSKVYQIYQAGTNQEYPTDKLPIRQALKGEIATADDLEVHQGGKIIPLEVWATPIYDAKGKITYAINAFQDITERQKAETERIKLTRQLFQLNQSFSRFVPHQFLQLLGKKSLVDVQLGDQVQQEMSVLFSSIHDLGVLSESMTTQETFKFINSYLSRLEPVIIEHHGFIDKYIGDGIMALFGGSADHALKAGISMLQALANYNQHRLKSGYVPIQIGIGINTGSLMLGTVGGKNRMDGTVISDDVNLASRLEGFTKYYGVSLLISQQTFVRLPNPTQYCIRFIEQATVKGKSKPVAVFEVFDADDPEIKDGKLVTRTIFEEALFLYHQQAFRNAAQRFEDVLKINPNDKVAKIYWRRCQSPEAKILTLNA
jgi:adenylate cyclase